MIGIEQVIPIRWPGKDNAGGADIGDETLIRVEVEPMIPVEIEESQRQRHNQNCAEGQTGWISESGAKALSQAHHGAIVRIAYDFGRVRMEQCR